MYDLSFDSFAKMVLYSQEILENGFSAEVESVKENDWYRKMKV